MAGNGTLPSRPVDLCTIHTITVLCTTINDGFSPNQPYCLRCLSKKRTPICIRKSLHKLHKKKPTPPPPFPTAPQKSTQQRLSNLTLPTFCSLEPVRMALVIQHSLVDLFLRIQNKWTILHNFLIEREAGNEDCKKKKK